MTTTLLIVSLGIAISAIPAEIANLKCHYGCRLSYRVPRPSEGDRDSARTVGDVKPRRDDGPNTSDAYKN